MDQLEAKAPLGTMKAPVRLVDGASTDQLHQSTATSKTIKDVTREKPATARGGDQKDRGGRGTNRVFQCSQCVKKQATLWCQQCLKAFCGICWIRSPSHMKTNILLPAQRNGPKPPYFTVDAFSEATHQRHVIGPLPSSNPRDPNNLLEAAILQSASATAAGRGESPPSGTRSSNHFLHRHEFDRKPANKPKELRMVTGHKDYPLPPVYLDRTGDVHHFQRVAELRPQTTPDFRALRGATKSRPGTASDAGRNTLLLPGGGNSSYTESVSSYQSRPNSPVSALRQKSPPPSPALLVYNALRLKKTKTDSVDSSQESEEEGSPTALAAQLEVEKDMQQGMGEVELLAHREREKAKARAWMEMKKPLRVTPSRREDDEVPAAYAISGGPHGGSTLGVAYSAKPAVNSVLRVPSAKDIDAPRIWTPDQPGEILTDRRRAADSGGEGEQEVAAVQRNSPRKKPPSREREYQIINGTAVFVKPSGLDEKEAFLLWEMLKEEEKTPAPLHQQPFRLP